MRVNLLNTKMSQSTCVAIVGRKQAVDLYIIVVPPFEAADNFLMHMCDMPRRPNETDGEYINHVIPHAARGECLGTAAGRT